MPRDRFNHDLSRAYALLGITLQPVELPRSTDCMTVGVIRKGVVVESTVVCSNVFAREVMRQQ